MLALTVLNGNGVLDFQYLPILKKLPFVPQMMELSTQSLFIVLVLAAIGFQVFRSGLSFLGQYATLQLTMQIQSEAQNRVYGQILRLNFPSVSRYKVGDLVEYARAPSVAIPAVMESINKVLVSVLMSIALILVMSSMSVSLTLTTLFLLAFFAASQKFIIRKISHGSTQLTEQLTELSKHTVQSLHGIRALFTFNRQEDVLNKTLETLQKIISATKKVTLWNNSIVSINETLGMVLVGSCLSIGVFLLQSDQPSLLPILLTFITVTHRLTNRLQAGMIGFGGIATHIGNMLRINEIISDEGKEFISNKGDCFPGLVREITFDHVSLRYDDKNDFAVEQLSLTIPKGSMVAFVGASGAGKSSILDVLLKLYNPSAGTIWVDGKDLSQYNEKSWRQRLGVVSQDAIIFNESIEENIRFGNLNATNEQIQAAAKSAGIHEFILHLPAQYQTILGERGYRLSGGERQRISLARALLREPEILILDEATSNLDSHSEHLIQQALEKLQNKTTMIVVAHRLSTIRNADRIFVLEKGKLIQEGTHQELLQRMGRYAYFWNLQSTIAPDLEPAPSL
jgi:ATP-binding cassette subfamily B protein/subfamily B ATP-binding cassette protein MsbA